jgi:hypothetical protein
MPRDVRLLAAQGTLAPRAHEQLTLLMLLVADEDREIAAAAEATVARLPREPLAGFLARSDVTADMKEFFVGRGFAVATAPAASADSPVTLDGAALHPDTAAPGSSSPVEAPEAAAEQTTRMGTAQRLAMLTVAERVKIAMQGSREERAILVRDPNRLVSSAVLSSPKLTESEVEAIARMSNVSDDVLRVLGTSRVWIKNYQVVSALTRNAKTPIAVSLHLVPRLTERDIKMLSTDRNIPEPVRVAARKQLTKGAARRD